MITRSNNNKSNSTMSNNSSIRIINRSPTSIKEIVFNNGISDQTHHLYTYRKHQTNLTKYEQIEKNVNTYKMTPLRTSKYINEDVNIQLNTTNDQINTQNIKVAISYDTQFYYVKNKLTNEIYQIDKSDIKKLCKTNNSLLSDKGILRFAQLISVFLTNNFNSLCSSLLSVRII